MIHVAARAAARVPTWIAIGCCGLVLAGCGGSDPAPRDTSAAVAAARTYATTVAGVTARTRAALASISAKADYRGAESAASSTRQYATTIRVAAQQLEAASPPAAVAAQHRALAALYRTTANRMEVLAQRFALASGAAELASRAQDLSGEVQRYSSQEQQLRSAIERGLAESAGLATTPAPTTGAPAN